MRGMAILERMWSRREHNTVARWETARGSSVGRRKCQGWLVSFEGGGVGRKGAGRPPAVELNGRGSIGATTDRTTAENWSGRCWRRSRSKVKN